MTDPFERLREPIVPLAPRPEFARELRRRIAAELGPDPEETTMHALAIREYTPARLHSLTPYLRNERPDAPSQWYAGRVRRGAARRSDRDARRPHRSCGAARRRHRVHARGRVPRRGPPEPGDARRQHRRI